MNKLFSLSRNLASRLSNSFPTPTLDIVRITLLLPHQWEPIKSPLSLIPHSPSSGSLPFTKFCRENLWVFLSSGGRKAIHLQYFKYPFQEGSKTNWVWVETSFWSSMGRQVMCLFFFQLWLFYQNNLTPCMYKRIHTWRTWSPFVARISFLHGAFGFSQLYYPVEVCKRRIIVMLILEMAWGNCENSNLVKSVQPLQFLCTQSAQFH